MDKNKPYLKEVYLCSDVPGGFLVCPPAIGCANYINDGACRKRAAAGGRGFSPCVARRCYVVDAEGYDNLVEKAERMGKSE